MNKLNIKKSLLIMFAFSVLFLCSGICNAETITVRNTISSEIDFSFIEPRVEHERINTVLANGILNAKILADFGDATSATAVFQYRIDSGEVVEVTKDNVINKRYFYLGTPEGAITKDNSVVEYRVKVSFTSGEGDFVVYAPAGASQTDFISVPVISKIEKAINGDDGDTIEVFCGDQSKGENGTVKVVVPEGAYSGEHNVVVDFAEESLPSPTKERIISTVSVEVEDISEIGNPIQILNLPLQTKTQANKFYMQYENGLTWETEPNANLNVNKMYQTYSFVASRLGNYRAVEELVLTDSSYRPENRIVVKNKIGSNYPGFEFKYLKEGDKINIYNLKGKNIRKISVIGTGNTVVWDGKRDNGDWAESGTYIYQIKVDGKIISGTIAFVW